MLTPAQVTSDPALFARHFLKIRDKQKELVRLRWNRAQQHFHANRTGRDLVLKARQLGFSTYIQGEMYRRTVTATRTTITLAHDTDTTQKLRRMADRFHEYCKFGDIQPARKYANASLTTYPEFDSTATIATAGNVNTGRGDTYTDFHGSEVAFWPDAERIVAGAMQGGSPDVILESTPNGAQGHFYNLCTEALTGDSVWTLHFYPWWWDDAYRIELEDGQTIRYSKEERKLADAHDLDAAQILWRREKKRELKDLFPQEYPEDPLTCFLTSGKSYFGDVSHVYTAAKAPRYNAEHRYRAGLDFAQTTDYTVLIVIDHTENRMVDMLRINRQSWGAMRREIQRVSKKWGNVPVLAEGNSIGSVNVEELARANVPITAFTTTNASKADIMADLKDALIEGGLKLQDSPALRHEMNNFVSKQLPSGVWRLAADGDGHDDTVIALALANQPGGWLSIG